MIVAAVEWSVFVPATITALALAYTSVRSTQLNRQNQRHLADIVPKVTAIDAAVNGQPPGAEHMGEAGDDVIGAGYHPVVPGRTPTLR